MKRLIKKSSNITLFHGTSFHNLQEITKKGMIIPQGGTGVGFAFKRPTIEEEKNYEGFIFLSTTLENALMYTEYFNEPNFLVVIEVSMPDEKLLPDNIGCYQCDTWIDSANLINQVKISGIINNHLIKKIHFFDAKTKKKIIDAKYENWQYKLKEWI